MKAQALRRACFVCLFLPIANITGGTQTFSDRSLFLNAVKRIQGEQQALTFDHLIPPLSWDVEIGPSLQVSNVTFAGRFLIASRYPEITSSGTVLYNFDGGGPLSISFTSSAVRAFGADWGSIVSQHASFTATLTLDSASRSLFNRQRGLKRRSSVLLRTNPL